MENRVLEAHFIHAKIAERSAEGGVIDRDTDDQT